MYILRRFSCATFSACSSSSAVFYSVDAYKTNKMSLLPVTVRLDLFYIYNLYFTSVRLYFGLGGELYSATKINC